MTARSFLWRLALILAAVASVAVLLWTGSVAGAATVKPWATCAARRIHYFTQATNGGPAIGYRIGDDLFAGRRGELCISTTLTRQGANLTVRSNIPAQPGGVAAAPYIRVGPWYGAGDSQSPFPMPVTAMGRLTLHVNVTGTAPGEWIADTDTYGYRTAAAVTGNPSVELVIATRWHEYLPDGYGRVRVGGHWWSVNHHITGGGTMGPHPLIIFWINRQDPRIAERLPAFIAWARARGWWPAADRVTGNTCLQDEIWSQGRGLRLGLQVTDPMPVIRSGG